MAGKKTFSGNEKIFFYRPISYQLDPQRSLNSLNLLERGFVGCFEFVYAIDFGMYFGVELDLRFCARRADGDLRAIFGEVLEDVRGRRHVERQCFARDVVFAFQGREVVEEDDLRAGNFCQRVFAEMLHHRLDFFGAALAFLHDRDAFFFRESVFHVDLLQELVDGHAIVFSPSGDFSKHGTGRYGVFVAHEVFAQETVALFASADEVQLAFVLLHDGGNPLKSGVDIVEPDGIALGDRADGLGRHDGLDDVFLALDFA